GPGGRRHPRPVPEQRSHAGAGGRGDAGRRQGGGGAGPPREGPRRVPRLRPRPPGAGPVSPAEREAARQGEAMSAPVRWPRCGWWIGAVVGRALCLLLCLSRWPDPRPPEPTPEGPEPGFPWFVEVTQEAGIDFIHFDSATPMHYIQETIGSGLAWIDYDNDGWPDLFCVQDGP